MSGDAVDRLTTALIDSANRQATEAFKAGHARCTANMGSPLGKHDRATSARELDRKLDRPERPCAQCGAMFQPTTQRRMLCAACFHQLPSGE